MLIRVKSVKYLTDYKLKIVFNDGKARIVDFENWVRTGKGYLVPLKNINYFKKVHIDDCHYTICWPNGADFCPDVLYDMGTDFEVAKEISSKSVRVHPVHKKLNSRIARKDSKSRI